MPLRQALFAALTAALLVGPALAAETVRTSIAPKDCVLYSAFELGAAWACRGVGGFNLAVTEADARMEFEIVSGAWSGNAPIETRRLNGAFSYFPEEQAVWWMQGDAPSALSILIGYASPEGGDGPRYHLVARIDADDAERSCLIAAVPDGPGAAEQTARIAAAPGDRACLF